jgi:hypothetical protein
MLKEILDSLPDEASKKRFSLSESDFKDWIIDDNYSKLVGVSIGTSGFNNMIKEKIIEIDDNIEDVVIKKLIDASNSKQDIIDIISLKDKSYRQQNHALTRTKRVINNNIEEVFEPFGYEKGSIRKSSLIKGNDNPNEYKDVRLVIGKLTVRNTGDNILFPKLENVTEEIEIADSWVGDVENLKNPLKINFPLLENVNKLKINMPFISGELNFDSLKTINNLETGEANEDGEGNGITLNFPKLEKLSTEEGIFVAENSSFNAPLLKQINSVYNESNDAYLDIDGKFNAPNLKFLDGDINVGDFAEVNFDSLEELTTIKVTNNTIKLPNLKKVSVIKAHDNANIYLDNISFDGAGYNFKAIYASGNSQVFINKINTNKTNAKNVSIDASGQSKITINEIEREGGFNMLGGISEYKAIDESEINVL